MKQNKNNNLKALQLILIPSVGLGWFIDQLLKFNNYTFLITGFLPLIMIIIYYEYLFIDNNDYKITKSKFQKWRHKLFTFIWFLFIIRMIFSVFALLLGVVLIDIENSNQKNLFLAISATTISVSIFGDKLLHSIFKSGGLENALENKEDFFNQNNVKMFIYFVYFILIIITNYGIKSETAQIWINTFATYVAFERFWKFWKDQNNKV